MSTAAPDPFSPDVGAAVTAHMNGDHLDDCLLIVRGLGGLPMADAATMTGVAPDGALFSATVEGVEHDVIVPWAIPITERLHFRLEVVRMYQEACEVLGLEPRQAEQH